MCFKLSDVETSIFIVASAFINRAYIIMTEDIVKNLKDNLFVFSTLDEAHNDLI